MEGDGGGGGDPAAAAAAAAAAAEKAKTDPKPELKYTDEQVNSFKADAKKEAINALLKEHGIESTGKLKEDLAALKKIQDADKTEAQRLADDNKAKDTKLTEVESRALAAEVKVAAMVGGVDPAKVERAAKLIPAYDGETPADKVKAFLTENPEFKSGPAKPMAPAGLDGKVKNQETPEAQAAANAFNTSLGLRPAKS